jgi:hypothetical protein
VQLGAPRGGPEVGSKGILPLCPIPDGSPKQSSPFLIATLPYLSIDAVKTRLSFLK